MNFLPGFGYGGAEYGYSRYGSGGSARSPVPVRNGYGGRPYGLSSYGSVDSTRPRVSSVRSVSGTELEIFFSEPMRTTASLLDPAGYNVAASLGAPTEVTEVVRTSSASLLLTVTGTTLGGTYLITVPADLEDRTGKVILPSARSASCRTLGSLPTLSVTPLDGETLRIDSTLDMLEDEGLVDPSSYTFTTTYPISLEVLDITAATNAVTLSVSNMTSATYQVAVSEATAIQYIATYLPSTATTFEGQEYGTGTSALGSPSGLLLSKQSDDVYGWVFLDTVAEKLVPGTTFRADITFNASNVLGLTDEPLCTFTISDSEMQVAITCTEVLGTPVLEITSGSYTTTVPAVWSSGRVTLSLIRNIQADLYSVLLNGVPLLSVALATFDGSAVLPSGISFLLQSYYEVNLLPLESVSVTASQTVYTSAWNFLHNVTASFTGSALLTRDTIWTQRGPLTKNWGDATPATPQDVEVRVNDVVVEVAAVNPYLGTITPAIPIPLTDDASVEITYSWFPNPIMAMPGLNIPGVVLNKWDRPMNEGRLNLQNDGKIGAMDTHRFQMGLVLPPLIRLRPVQIGHRYIGFEKEYTASLNAPNSLLLNQNPNKIARDSLSMSVSDFSVLYTGDALPDWTLVGSAATTLSSGRLLLTPDRTATDGNGMPALYYREADLSFPAVVNAYARLQIGDPVSLEGIYTGVCFGVHDNRFLFLAGFLEVNGVPHVGILKDASKPYLLGSWVVGPSFTITITGSNTFHTTEALPLGSVFQILEGVQAGVYTVSDCDPQAITGVFPASPTRWAAKTATGYLAAPWRDALHTYRLVARTDTGEVQLVVGSRTLMLARAPAQPAQMVLPFNLSQKGAFFWGSSSAVNTLTSEWSNVRFGVTYDQVTQHFQGITVTTDFDTLDYDWFRLGPQMDVGTVIQSGGLPVGWARLEPFLGKETLIDVDAVFQGQGVRIRIDNGDRAAYLGALYHSGGVVQNDPPVLFVSGDRDPTLEGWTRSGGLEALNYPLRLDADTSFTGRLDTDDPLYTDILTTRFVLESPEEGSVGIVSGARYVGVLLRPAEVLLVNRYGTTVQSIGFNTGGKNTYQLVTDPTQDVVTLMVNGVLLMTAALSTFPGGLLSNQGTVTWGGAGLWYSLTCTCTPGPGIGRTLGVLLAGGSSWVLPRDSMGVVVEMDWRSPLQVRFRLDPGWGAVLYRPDLPPPPGWNGQQATTSTDPSAGWVSVEYRRLPRGVSRRVTFGALEGGVSTQNWTTMRYRVYTNDSGNYVAPQHMVLNWANVINSGELLRDTGVESLLVEPLSSSVISLRPTNITADRVFSVVCEDVVLGPSDWTFVPATQMILLAQPLPVVGVPVTVNFAPGNPVSNTYLCSQPLLQSNTILNEGTPLVPKSQVGTATREEVFGSGLNEPGNTLGDLDFVLNDPFRTVTFSENGLYEALEFCSVEDGGETGLIASLSDGELGGLVAVGLSGTSFSDGGPRWIRDSVGGFEQNSVLHASGGGYRGAPLGRAILYPSYPAIPGPDRGAVIRALLMQMRGVWEEDMTSASGSDATPPSFVRGQVNPNGTPNLNGACAVEIVDLSTSTYSRVGPWGGLSCLSPHSLLNVSFIVSGGAPLV